MSESRENPRFPYTYAYDLIRQLVPGEEKVGSISIRIAKLSRAEAAQITQLFSEVLGISKEEIATKLAEKYLAEKEDQ